MKKAVSVILLVLLCLAPLTACRSDRQSIDLTQFQGKIGVEGNSTRIFRSYEQDGFIYYFIQDKNGTFHLYEYDTDAKTNAPISFIKTEPRNVSGAESIYGKEYTFGYDNILAAGKYFITLSDATRSEKRSDPSDTGQYEVSNIDIYSMDGRYHQNLVKTTSKLITTGAEHPDTTCLNYKDNNLYYLKYGGGGPLCRYNLKTQKNTEIAQTVVDYIIHSNAIYYIDASRQNTLWKMSINGTDKIQINAQSFGCIQISNNKIFYIHGSLSDGDGLYSMNLDGSDPKRIYDGHDILNPGDYLAYYEVMNDRKIICMIFNSQNTEKDTNISIEEQSDGTWIKTHDYGISGFFSVLGTDLLIDGATQNDKATQSYLIDSDTGEKTVLSH